MSSEAHPARRMKLLPAVIEEARRRAWRRRRRHGATLLVVAVAGIGLYAVLGHDRGGGQGGAGSATGLDGDGASVTLRSLEWPPGEVRWTLVGGPGDPCYEVEAEAVRGNDRGLLSGSCASSGPMSWSLGGIEVGGDWYNVIDGTAAAKVSSVRVHLRDGTTRSEAVANGVWLVVVPGPNPARDNGFDVRRIEAVDRSGTVLARDRPPSIRALHAMVRRQEMLGAPVHGPRGSG